MLVNVNASADLSTTEKESRWPRFLLDRSAVYLGKDTRG